MMTERYIRLIYTNWQRADHATPASIVFKVITESISDETMYIFCQTLRKLLESDNVVLKLLQRNLYKDLYFYSVGSTTVVH